MEAPLKDKVAIVTGGAGETGAVIALTLASAGSRVVVNDINPDRAESVAAAICDAGYQALAITADVGNRFQCVNLIESTRTQWGQLDILVNNASVRPVAPVLKMDEWAWQRCFDVNLKSAFFMSQLVGRVMVDENLERGGVIVNVIDGTLPTLTPAGMAAYAASKAALFAFTQACIRELAPYHIRVYAEPAGEAGAPFEQQSSQAVMAQYLAERILEHCLDAPTEGA